MTGSTRLADPQRRTVVRHLMSMPISITVRGPRARDESTARVVEAAFTELAWVEDVFSLWRPDSELSRLRRGELDVSDCVPQMSEVFGLCRQATECTRGAFRWLWPAGDGSHLPEPTGLVKGWAIERAAGILSVLEEHAYCVNAGGDIAVGGTLPGGCVPTWRFGIENPHDRTAIARVVELSRGGLATSGTASRGAHLLHPDDGTPVDRAGSVSVWGPSLLWADVWATALFVGPQDLQRQLLREPGWSLLRL